MVSRFCDLRVLNNSFEFTIKVFLSPGDYIFRKKLVLNYVEKKEVKNRILNSLVCPSGGSLPFN